MQIIAHRGLWKKESEKNSLTSIEKAFESGYGIETDIRDFNGSLVISHNIADKNSESVERMFQSYNQLHLDKTLALNVKADGIQPLLIELLDKYQIRNYFLFDMSIPELVVNRAMKLKWYTRHSDIEIPVLYEEAEGIWFDCFYDDAWMTIDKIIEHLEQHKKVCIVSPELHKKPYEEFWSKLKNHQLYNNDNLILCTDIPDIAKEFFNV